MNISGRCDYACRAMLELALCYEAGAPVAAQVIAERRGIPEKYLTHILLQLKRAQLVNSMRGAQGGYTLSRVPEQITLLHIVTAIEGALIYPGNPEEADSSELSGLWKSVGQEVATVLERLSLPDMLNMTNRAAMFHI